MVTATRADGKGIWTTISGTDGIYSIANIAPGEYQITTQAEGYPDVTGVALQVAAGKATRGDIAMTITVPQPAVISANQPPPAPAVTNAAHSTSQSVLQRLLRRTPTEAVNTEPVTTASLIPPASAFDTRASLDGPANPSPQGPAAAAPAPQAAEPAAPATDIVTPFADWDWTWLNGNTRQHDSPLDCKYFSGEFRADTFYGDDFNQPVDHSMGGSSEVFRNGEVQLEDLSIGGDFHDGNMRGRVLLLFGMFSATTVRNDPSPAVGQWDVRVRLQICVGGVWRIPLQRAARPQRRCRNLRFVRRSVQLSQLR